MSNLELKKGTYNKINTTFDRNLTGSTVEYRLKKNREDITTPLVEGTVTITTYAATSLGDFEIDLSTDPLNDLIGNYYIDFKIYNNLIPDKPVYTEIKPVTIVTTLKP